MSNNYKQNVWDSIAIGIFYEWHRNKDLDLQDKIMNKYFKFIRPMKNKLSKKQWEKIKNTYR